MFDISRTFKPLEVDKKVALELIKNTDAQGVANEKAIHCFLAHKDVISDYAYWYFLSTIWVSTSSGLDIETWKKLFLSKRSNRIRCLMKPSEVAYYKRLPVLIKVYRAHKVKEHDWISYSKSLEVAVMFVGIKNANKIVEYRIPRKYIYAIFLRQK